MELTPLFTTGLVFSSFSFVFYGLSCLFSNRVKVEFRRYKLDHFRALVGSLQIAGSLGLVGGIWLPALGGAAAMGLAMLMLLGLVVRKRLRDNVIQMIPAGVYLIINVYLAMVFITT